MLLFISSDGPLILLIFKLVKILLSMKERPAYSRIILNTLPWERMQKGRIIRLLHESVQVGSTFFIVSGPRKEEIPRVFAAAYSESGLSRDEIQLIAEEVNPTAAGLEDRVDELLGKLGTDYFDLLLLSTVAEPQALVEVFEKLWNQGKVCEVGIRGLPPGPFHTSGFSISVFCTSFEVLNIEQLDRLDSAQGESGFIRLLIDWDDQYLNRPALEAALTELCHKYNLSLQELIKAWLLQHPSLLSVVLSASNEREMERLEILSGMQWNPFDWRKIKLTLTGSRS